MERSVFSDRMVFVKAVHAAKYMSDTELAVYDSWFDPVLQSLPSLVPHGFVYLRAMPETCHRRMTSRARSEENSVNLGYLQVCGKFVSLAAGICMDIMVLWVAIRECENVSSVSRFHNMFFLA